MSVSSGRLSHGRVHASDDHLVEHRIIDPTATTSLFYGIVGLKSLLVTLLAHVPLTRQYQQPRLLELHILVSRVYELDPNLE